jgi:hypothetical protein
MLVRWWPLILSRQTHLGYWNGRRAANQSSDHDGTAHDRRRRKAEKSQEWVITEWLIISLPHSCRDADFPGRHTRCKWYRYQLKYTCQYYHSASLPSRSSRPPHVGWSTVYVHFVFVENTIKSSKDTDYCDSIVMHHDRLGHRVRSSRWEYSSTGTLDLQTCFVSNFIFWNKSLLKCDSDSKHTPTNIRS